MSFPTITPSACVLNPGDYAGTQFKSLNGVETRIRYTSLRTGTTLNLTFSNLTETSMRLIYDHYNLQGTFGMFPVPSNLFAGFTSVYTTLFNSTSVRWRYQEAPTITPTRRGRHTVQVQLVSIPNVPYS